MPLGSDKHTIGSVLDKLGMTRHHYQVTVLAWWIFFCSGWVYSLTPYLLDAVGGKDTDWVDRTSQSERMHDSTKSMAMLLAGVAALVGNPLMGILADSYGRIFTMLAAMFLVSIGTIGFAFSTSWQMLVVCMCLAPFGRDGTNPIAQSLLAEWVPIVNRGRLIVHCHMAFNVGRLALTLLWLCYPPRETWTAFFLSASALPVFTVAFLMLHGARYESPRWLALAGKYELLKANLHLAVQSSDSSLPENWDEPANLKLDGQLGISALSDGKAVSFAFGSLVDVRMTGMKATISFFGVCYFCLSYASWSMFVWTIDFLKAIEASSAVNAVLLASPLSKILGNGILVYPVFGTSPIDYFGRLLIFRIGMLGFGLFVFAICGCGTNAPLITGVIFMAMLFEEWVWTVGSACIIEAFPTNLRNTAFAYVLVCASAGAILANTISLGLLRLWQYLPVIVMASLLLIGFATTWALPEDRKDKPLIDTCEKQKEQPSYNSLQA